MIDYSLGHTMADSVKYDQHARHTDLTLAKVNLVDGMMVPRVSVVKLTLGSGSVMSELLVQ